MFIATSTANRYYFIYTFLLLLFPLPIAISTLAIYGNGPPPSDRNWKTMRAVGSAVVVELAVKG